MGIFPKESPKTAVCASHNSLMLFFYLVAYFVLDTFKGIQNLLEATPPENWPKYEVFVHHLQTLVKEYNRLREVSGYTDVLARAWRFLYYQQVQITETRAQSLEDIIGGAKGLPSFENKAKDEPVQLPKEDEPPKVPTPDKP